MKKNLIIAFMALGIVVSGLFCLMAVALTPDAAIRNDLRAASSARIFTNPTIMPVPPSYVETHQGYNQPNYAGTATAATSGLLTAKAFNKQTTAAPSGNKSSAILKSHYYQIPATIASPSSARLKVVITFNVGVCKDTNGKADLEYGVHNADTTAKMFDGILAQSACGTTTRTLYSPKGITPGSVVRTYIWAIAEAQQPLSSAEIKAQISKIVYSIAY